MFSFLCWTKGNAYGRMQDLHGLSAAGDSINLKSKDSPFSIQKQHAIFRGSSQTEFGVVSPDSLLNPSQRCSRMSSKTSDSLLGFNDHETQNQHLLRHFIDKCPKDQSHRASISWPEELKSDWTQLSMSIPMSTSDFSSSSRSPRQDKPTLSPLRLAREIDPIQMGLSVTKDVVGQNQKQANWLPASWGNSILGGPLGEVLNSTSSNVGAFKSSSTLNLMTDVWDNSLQMGCSPTGVLQKSTFVSLSNSSSGSSPRTDNKKAPEGYKVRIIKNWIIVDSLCKNHAISWCCYQTYWNLCIGMRLDRQQSLMERQGMCCERLKLTGDCCWQVLGSVTSYACM